MHFSFYYGCNPRGLDSRVEVMIFIVSSGDPCQLTRVIRLMCHSKIFLSRSRDCLIRNFPCINFCPMPCCTWLTHWSILPLAWYFPLPQWWRFASIHTTMKEQGAYGRLPSYTVEGFRFGSSGSLILPFGGFIWAPPVLLNSILQLTYLVQKLAYGSATAPGSRF